VLRSVWVFNRTIYNDRKLSVSLCVFRALHRNRLNVNWSNRNVFKGAELLTISAFGGLEVQVSGLNNGFNVYRFLAQRLI
jgi:hypothetical protein